MKLLNITLLFLLSFSGQAFFKDIKVGVGTLSENIGEVQTEDVVDGSTNGFEFNPFINIKGQNTFFIGLDYDIELGVSIPRSSRDSAVSRLNYWSNFLVSKKIGLFRPEIGLGFFFTRLSMNGESQFLSNGNDSSVEFSTPSGAVVATNNVVILGLTFETLIDLSFNGQINFLNIEDSEERSTNFFLSVNYSLGSLGL